MEERRRSQRYNCELEIEYSPKADGIIYSRSISKNISRGGIRIPILSRLVRAGDTVKFDIYPRDIKKRPVPALGRVVWTKETDEIAGHLLLDAEAGIEFKEINTRDLEKLLNEAQ